MDLVVELSVADEALGVSLVSQGVKQAHRVHRRHSVDVTRRVVPGGVSVKTVAVINRLGGVIVIGRTDGLLVRIEVLGVCSLTVQVDSEVVLKESRGKVEGKSPTVHLGSFEGTVLVGVTTGDTVRKEGSDLTVQADVTVVGLGVVVDLFLPVCVG